MRFLEGYMAVEEVGICHYMKLVACFSWRILPILLSCQDCGFVIRAVKYIALMLGRPGQGSNQILIKQWTDSVE